MDAVPVDALVHDGLRQKLRAVQSPFFILLEPDSVDDVADVLFAAWGIGVNVFLYETVGIEDDLHDAVLVGPDEEVLSQAGVALPGSPHDGQAVIFLFAPGEGPGGAFGDADAAADTFFLVPDDFVVLHAQGVHGEAFAALDAGLAGYAAGGVILGHGHPDDAEIVKSDFGAVIGASRQCDLEVQVVGEDGLLEPFGKFCRIVIGKGTDVVPDAGAHIPGAGSGVAAVFIRLVDVQKLDDGLEHLVDGIHVLQADAFDLEALPGGQMDDAVSVGLGDFLHHAEDFRFQVAAGNPDAGGADSPDFTDPVCVFLGFLCIDI